MESAHSDLRANRLLALLDDATLRPLAAHLEPVPLACRETLYEERKPMTHAWFPASGVISVLGASTADESPVEVATIGNEGMVGAFSLLEGDRAIGENLVQVAGDALRLDIGRFNQHLKESPAFYRLMQRYLYTLICQIVQAGACNRLHTMEERCARWLLMMHDRASTDTFHLTQDLLSEMLAVRRATVNLALGMLKTAGLIQVLRGQITVLDRPGLEAAACPCYDIIRREYAELSKPA